MKKIILFVAILLSFGLIIFGIYALYVNYEYEKVIGAYIENAYEVNTPDEMINQINLAIVGMANADLHTEDYGALIFKKPDNSMRWQYKYLENFLERAEAVKVWQEKISKDEKAIENLGDVYEQKMDNLREFLKENGRADWIAKSAWYIKNHFIMYFDILILSIWLVLLFILYSLAFFDFDILGRNEDDDDAYY